MKRMHVKAGNHSEAILFPDCKSRLALKRLAKKKKMFLSFFPASSVEVRVSTASAPLCLAFPSAL